MSKPIVLCVESNETVSEQLVARVNQRIGTDFECLSTATSFDALEMIDDIIDNGRELAVIICDQDIEPGLKGDELLIRVHTVFPETIKILLCGKEHLGSVANAIQKARLYRYVLKPWEEHDLTLTIEEAARSYMQYLQLLQYNQYNRLLRTLSRTMQELSSIIEYDKLIKKFINSVIEISDAEIGFLFLQVKDKLNIAAVAFSKTEQARRLQRDLVKPQPTLLQEVLVNLKQVLYKPFSKDYRMASSIAYKGVSLGYVYVENSISGAVFNSNQRDVLQMLGSQMAISLENARLYRSLEAKQQEIQTFSGLLEDSQSSLSESLSYAQKILFATLPNAGYLYQMFPEAFMIHIPRIQVGGDFFWWAEGDEAYVLAVVDCTGHGVPGAFMSVVVSNLLNQIVNQFGVFEPDAILQMLNVQLQSSMEEDYILSLSICVIDKKRTKVKYAGLKRPLLIQRGEELHYYYNNRFFMDPTTPPRIVYNVDSISLEHGDNIYLFTNGLTNLIGEKDNTRLLTRRLKELILENSGASMVKQGELLNNLLLDWKGNKELVDDVLVVGVKILQNQD